MNESSDWRVLSMVISLSVLTVVLLLLILFLTRLLLQYRKGILSLVNTEGETQVTENLKVIQLPAPTEVTYLRMKCDERDVEIRRLTNLLASQDPSTFLTLMSQNENQGTEVQNTIKTPSASSGGIGTDSAEYARWMAQNGVGEPIYTPDMADQGFDDLSR